MSIYQGSSTNPDRRPSLKGAVMVDVSMGKERVRAWPRPRGANQAPSVIRNQMLFRNYSWAIKYLAPEMMVQIYDARQGMPLLPRDVAMMMLSGTLLWFSTPSGKAIYSMAALQAVSQSLDAISQFEGYVLVRGADYWTAVPYSPGGQPWWWSPPDTSAWTAISGDANNLTITDSALAGASVDCGPISPSDVLRAKVQTIAAPGTLWTLAAKVNPQISGVNINSQGLIVRNSANGRLITIGMQSNAAFVIQKWTSLLNGSSTFYLPTGPNFIPQQFYRLTVASGYFQISISPDAITWIQVYVELISAWFINPPDEVGVFAREARTSGFQGAFNIQMWDFAT